MTAGLRFLFSASIVLLLAGCASQISSAPVTLASVQNAEIDVLSADVEVMLDTHYKRTLPKSTRLKHVGDVPEGRVLKPLGRVFTVEGAHIHEAYLVSASGWLVGFYLPGENAYSPLKKAVALPLSKEK